MAAELIVSSLLPVVIDKLFSETTKTVARYKGIGAEIHKWQRWSKQIQDSRTDASEKEITNDSVKQWLTALQRLAYDVDDLLDGWATEAMHREFTHASEATTSMVRKLIPTCYTNFSQSTMMLHELDSINARFKDLVKWKNEIGLKGEGKSGLRVEGEPRPKNTNGRSQSSSVVDPSRIVGRQAEIEDLVKRLLGDRPSDKKYSIVSIVGMGGVGKKTLAKLLYNEPEVLDHFELKAWVVVSDDFDSFAIIKVIYANVAGENKTFADLNLVQVDLVKQLREKRFLLVLDDIWSVSDREWENLVEPFYVCAPGSKIIITTRKEQLLTRLGCKDIGRLQSLSHDDAVSLFARHALSADNFDSNLSLKPHGEAIVKKCGGLPLVLVALATSLKTKEDEDSWRGVANSKIWTLEDGGGILPALRISYLDLSAGLKQLFAYCSLFPKDFLFDKEELVRLWMAEGFFPSSNPNDPTKESLGHTYFDELLSRSFFQHAPDNKSLFVMHDMMNELATSIASEFFLRFDNEKEGVEEETWKQYRHMSFVYEKYVPSEKFKTFEKAKSLRTFLATSVNVRQSYACFYLSDKILAEVLPTLPLLRVLSLSNFAISEVPESIGTLRHMRYLNLSHTKITHLPENVCSLYNLQTLILSGCNKLSKLPNSFVKLKNLRHFDISGTHELLKKMPLGIGELKSLQTLSKIIIEGENGFEILKDLENLYGKISIVGLEKVQEAKHAREANFLQKNFSELEFEWSRLPREKGPEKEVLNELKPCNDKLIQLKIKSYGGLEFPAWVGYPSFLVLKHVSIHDCSECTSLPPLGQLPSLKELFIGGLYRVKTVGMELFGAGIAFPSLEILHFDRMLGWEKWSTDSEAVFPRLQELHIKYYEKLVEVSLGALPPLNVLKIRDCDSGVLRRLVQVAKAVTKLEVDRILGLNDVVWRGVMEHLREVEELSIHLCNEIRYLWKSEAVASKFLVKLKSLEVSFCDNLMSLGEKEEEDDNHMSNLLTSLRSLHVCHCKNLKCCRCPDGVEMLSVIKCSSITTISLPSGGQKLMGFFITDCKKLLETEWGGKKMSNNIIEKVSIGNWPNLKSVIELSYFVHLTYLSIESCENLESFPDNELAKLTSLKNMEIFNCPRMDACFPRGVWPPNLNELTIGKLKTPISKWGTQNFPTSLERLSLYGGGDEDGVSSCRHFSDILPSSINFLSSEGLQHITSLKDFIVSDCPNLKKLSYPQHLQHLYFEKCPNMIDLPEDLLPSLLSFRIFHDCSKLKERCSERGIYCYPISYIPCIHID